MTSNRILSYYELMHKNNPKITYGMMEVPEKSYNSIALSDNSSPIVAPSMLFVDHYIEGLKERYKPIFPNMVGGDDILNNHCLKKHSITEDNGYIQIVLEYLGSPIKFPNEIYDGIAYSDLFYLAIEDVIDCKDFRKDTIFEKFINHDHIKNEFNAICKRLNYEELNQQPDSIVGNICESLKTKLEKISNTNEGIDYKPVIETLSRMHKMKHSLF